MSKDLDVYVVMNSFFDLLATEIAMAKNRIAHHQSLYSDPADLIILLGPVRTSYDAIACRIALEILVPGTRNRYQIFEQYEYFDKLVRNNRFEGHWKTVARLLCCKTGIYNLLKVLTEEFDGQEIFGNLVPKIRARINYAKPRSRSRLALRKERQRIVKKPIRRRGYRDKGSVRSNPPLGNFDPSIREEKQEFITPNWYKPVLPRPHEWYFTKPERKTQNSPGDTRKVPHPTTQEGIKSFETIAGLLDYQ